MNLRQRWLPGLKILSILLLGLLASCSEEAAPLSSSAVETSSLIITGVVDGSLSGGVPKAVELYTVSDVPDLSVYGLESANNGGGSSGPEFTFPAASLNAGESIYVSSEAQGFSDFFGFAPDYTSSAVNVNGDDAIVLFQNGAVVDIYGDPNTDGTGQPWEYLDGWAYRQGNTNSDADFVSTDWAFSGPNALDGAASNEAASTPFPIGSFQQGDTGGGTGGNTGGETGGEVGQCSDAATLISTVQGSGAESPLAGQSVTVEGVVIGDFQDDDVVFSDLGGFYVQEEAADDDNDPATSEGVYVFAPDAAEVSQGDLVRVSGTVIEFNGLTELTDVTVQMCGTASLPEPVDITLPLTSRDDLERVEGMVVRFPQDLVISEYFNYDRFGEIVLALPPEGLDRPFQPTSYVEPGPVAAQIEDLNDLSRITLDDGRATQNPDPARHPNGAAFTLENRFRGGDTVANAVGILDYRFNQYRLQPTQGADYKGENSRPDAPEEVGGSLKVASFNVLNYFTTLGERGADNAEEFERQRAKIIAALAEIDADVVGLVELENNGGTPDAAIQNLVDGLNNELGAGTYAAINTGVIGTDAITVGMIYKPATVTPVGDFAVLDAQAFTDPNNLGQQKNRPALAQTFREEVTGGVVTVVANHFKSKGSPCGAGDDDPQQGSCNDTRLKAAAALAEWLATDPTNSDDPDVLILGDLNAYDEEDPIDQLKADGYIDLVEAFEGEFAYSYVFSGEFGHLDYALANEALFPQVTGTTEWHINADEPDLLDYNTDFKDPAQVALYEPNPYRSSDHDPVVVGLNLTPERVDPAQAIPALIKRVQMLRDEGALTRGQANSLQKKLEKSLKSLERKGPAKAAKDLGQFIKKVRAFVRGGVLSADIGESLVADAERIVDALH